MTKKKIKKNKSKKKKKHNPKNLAKLVTGDKLLQGTTFAFQYGLN